MAEDRCSCDETRDMVRSCYVALFGRSNGGATTESVTRSVSSRLERLESEFDGMREEITMVRRAATVLQVAGALVGAAVVGLQIITLAMKLMG